jgi:Glycosyl transferase family 2
MNSAPLPAVSVVLATRDTGPILKRCLDSLAHQTLRDSETIVAVASGQACQWALCYPAVRFLVCSSSLDDPQLLQLALGEARGGIVAVTNSHCMFPPDWLEKMRRAHDSEFAVIGGVVGHGGPDTLAAWACYLADYGAFAPGSPRRVTSILAGNHISYKSRILQESTDALRDGYWKVFLLQDLDRRAIPCLFEPALVVSCVQTASFPEFARSYYRNACRFAALRARGFSFGARLVHIVTAPALPAVLLYRRIRSASGKAIGFGRLLAVIPLLGILTLYWSAGELTGYAAGFTRFGSRTGR